MKRASSPAPDDDAAGGWHRRRQLKRANLSLFSIATLVDSADSLPSLLTGGGGGGGGGDGGTSSSGSGLVLDDDDATATYSSLKASGLVPLDCSDDVDGDVPHAVSSSCCSSSEPLDEHEEGDGVAVCKSIEKGNNRPTMMDTALDLDDLRDSSDEKSTSHDAPVGVCCSSDMMGDATSSTSSPPCEAAAISECKNETRRRTTANKSAGDHRTGLVFESGSRHFDRRNRYHKERPLRITSVRDYLANAEPSSSDEKTVFQRCRLLEGCGGGGRISDECPVVESKRRSPEELWLDDHDYLRVHLPGYMQRLDRISKCNCHDRLDIEAEQFKSIYLTSDSVLEAKAAASSFCNLVSRVVASDDELDNGFAVIRPPGHHAEPGLAGGYCVVNNVAVAAAYAREKLGVERVLIVDWDVHHGNGTQKCFIDNPTVLYFSVHRYHGGNFFPFLQNGGPTSVGTGAGEGFNVNVGWNDKKMGDDEYLVLWERLLMPLAKEFRPDLVLVSAGFDAARGDMGECDVSPECFARLTRRLKTLAGGRVVCALEGGYVRSVLCRCIESVLAALLDSDSDGKCKEELCTFHWKVGDNDMLDCINPSAAKSIRETIKAHCKYWNCLKSDG